MQHYIPTETYRALVETLANLRPMAHCDLNSAIAEALAEVANIVPDYCRNDAERPVYQRANFSIAETPAMVPEYAREATYAQAGKNPVESCRLPTSHVSNGKSRSTRDEPMAEHKISVYAALAPKDGASDARAEMLADNSENFRNLPSVED